MKKIIFIFYHFLIPIFLYFLAKIINYPYGYICFIPTISFVILIDILVFCNHICKYPLNKYEEYKVNILKDNIVDYDNDLFVIRFIKEKNVYISTSGSKKLKFDMKSCIFPKSFIRAYFIKKLNLIMYNRMKKPLFKLGYSSKLPKSFKYSNLIIEFRYCNKVKKYYLVKDFKTKTNQLITEIILAPFDYLALNPLGGFFTQHIHIDES